MNSITTNEFLYSVLLTESWKKVSESESLSMDMLIKNEDKLDWKEISGNRNVLWTVDGINKFAYKLDWELFSDNCPDYIICDSTLNKFANRWNWKRLSNRDRFYNNWELLEKYADKADWSEIITNWDIEKPIEFFTRFQQYIPMTKLQDSQLWSSIVENCAKAIMQEITGIE